MKVMGVGLLLGLGSYGFLWLMREAYTLGYEHARDGKPWLWDQNW